MSSYFFRESSRSLHSMPQQCGRSFVLPPQRRPQRVAARLPQSVRASLLVCRSWTAPANRAQQVVSTAQPTSPPWPNVLPLGDDRRCCQQDRQFEHTVLTAKGKCNHRQGPAHLLRMFGIHQRYHRYVPRHDYLSGPSNPVADALSRDFHLKWVAQLAEPPHPRRQCQMPDLEAVKLESSKKHARSEWKCEQNAVLQ